MDEPGTVTLRGVRAFFLEESVMTDSRVLLTPEQVATAMKSPDHLRAWVEASGRRWLVLDGVEFTKALPFPHGVEAFMDMLAAYRDERRAVWTGRLEKYVGKNELTGDKIDTELRVMKGEHLEVEELDRAVRYLVAQILELDPTWSLDRPAL